MLLPLFDCHETVAMNIPTQPFVLISDFNDFGCLPKSGIDAFYASAVFKLFENL